jgi:hypothetical protein
MKSVCGSIPITSHGQVVFTEDIPCRDSFLILMEPGNERPAYATYLGGSRNDQINAVAIDKTGDTYVVGSTDSPDFPFTRKVTTEGPRFGGFFARFNREGQLVWAIEVPDFMPGQVACADTFIAIAGSVGSGNWSDVEVARFDADGHQIGSFQIGGTFTEVPLAMTTEHDDVYVAGYTASVPSFAHLAPNGQFDPFPVTALDLRKGRTDIFLIKVRADRLVWSSVFGGSGDDSIASIAVRSGEVYFGGATFYSPDLPMLPNSLQKNYGGGYFGKFAADGETLSYISYFGVGRYDRVEQVFVDGEGRLTIAGRTQSSDFPNTPASFGPCSTGYFPTFPNGSQYVAQFDPEGTTLEFARLLPDGIVASSTMAWRRGTSRPLEPVPLHSPCVVNGASFRLGPLAPGMLFTVAGPDVRSIARIVVDGVTAQVLFRGESQLNAIAPVALEPGKRVVINAEPSFSTTIETVDSAATILTVDANGRGLAIAWNADGSRNGPDNPALSCSAVTVLATGTGSGIVTAAGTFGAPAPALLVRADGPGLSRVTFRLNDFSPGYGVYRYEIRLGTTGVMSDQPAFVYAKSRHPPDSGLFVGCE